MSGSGAAVAWPLLARSTKVGPQDEFDAIAGRAPAARDLLDGTCQHLGLIDADIAGHVGVPVLAHPGGSHHVEAGQIAAMGTAQTRALVGEFDSHPQTLGQSVLLAGDCHSRGIP